MRLFSKRVLNRCSSLRRKGFSNIYSLAFIITTVKGPTRRKRDQVSIGKVIYLSYKPWNGPSHLLLTMIHQIYWIWHNCKNIFWFHSFKASCTAAVLYTTLHFYWGLHCNTVFLIRFYFAFYHKASLLLFSLFIEVRSSEVEGVPINDFTDISTFTAGQNWKNL